MAINKLTYRTEHYYGSKKQIHTIKWDPSEIDGREVKRWCLKHLGKSGYQEEIEDSRWVDNIDSHEIMLCKDEDFTHFLLVWQ